ncbi:MAG: alanine--glyoxylate aminotransferase family protein, partial [Pseudomonadota bacterium]
DPAIKSGAKFAAVGTQIAAGVPLEIGEPDDYASFRIGLFGIDKLKDIPTTVGNLRHALERVAQHP